MKLLFLILALFLSACMPTKKEILKDSHAQEVEDSLTESFQKVKPPTKVGPILWSSNTSSMFTDKKAFQKGDIITVIISEKATASRKIDLKKSKKNDRTGHMTSLLGLSTSLAAKNPNITPSAALNVGTSNNFSGSGQTSNSDDFTARIAAVVIEVYPNGNLKVTGRKELEINQQPQVLEFTGVIRHEDITADNTVESTKVANAKVKYGSAGSLSTVVHEGWLSQALEYIWPF